MFESFQSGYHSGHNTGTILMITNDLSIADGSPSRLILLDLTAEFDLVDHNILLHIYGTLLRPWYTSTKSNNKLK